jgi:hypothetical protein
MAWELYQWGALIGFAGGTTAIFVALYSGWDTFKFYTVADVFFGVVVAVILCGGISFTWPLSVPVLLAYRLYLWWEHRNGSHLAGDR